MKRLLYVLIFLFLFTSQSFAVLDTSQMLGEYSLSSFKLKYDVNPITITSSNATHYTGRLSMTTKGFVAELSGSAFGQYMYQWYCGFYSILNSTTIYVTITGEPANTLNAAYDNGTLITSGYQYDTDGYRYWLETTWTKKQSYYTSAGYSQTQLDQIVANAVASAEEKKNTIINSQLITIQSMFTKAQLDQAVAGIETAKNNIIEAKNITISQLSDMDGDDKTEMKDVIWALKVLSGEK